MNYFSRVSKLPFQLAVVLLLSGSVLFFLGNKEKETAVPELDGLKVPEGFTIERAVDPGMISYPMFASFDGDGRLFVFESDGSSPTNEGMLKKPPYHIRLLEDTDGDGKFDKSKIFADSLSFPKGGVFYNGSLYVTSSPDLIRLTDTDGDGVADKREVVLTGWVLNSNGALLGGPFLGPDGWLYLTDARRGFDITTKEGKNLKGSSARIWRCRPDGSGLESMAGGGFDNSIELAFMPSGETVGTMTYFIEPQAGMRDAIMHWVEGGAYPKYNPVIEKDKFILTGDLMPVMNKMARVAPSGIMRYRGNTIGKEYQGNLFSAEFNTGRIMRHKVIADGATYKTVDEPFVTSGVQDMHLTDVLEDADGSMLILNTGGWFILGCPLSRVAKLDVPGGIYRIRKTGAAKVNDPWGTKLNLRSMAVPGLIAATKDARLAVRDNAIELLISKGEAAVLPIKNSLLKSVSEEMRAAGIFALSRIATPNAMTGVRSGLIDPSAVVKTAAARALGLAKDKASVDKLMELVQKERFAVRRQAATALGQIGDKRAVPALLKAAAINNDRVEEHALIYALIGLNNTAPLVAALNNPSPNVKRTALIALDQIGGTALKKENLSPFLTSKTPQLQKIGIWVASHHPEWSDIVIGFLKGRLNSAEIAGADLIAIRDLMITFSNDKQLQTFLAEQLDSKSASDVKKIFLIDVITHASVKEIPEVWVQTLAKLLDSGSTEIKSQVLGLIESRRIKALNDQLSQIVQNVNTSPDFRLKALSSKLLSVPSLSDTEFTMVFSYLGNKNESPVRQMAARLLSNAKLTDNQLVKLADEQVAKTDVYLLPSLVSAFKNNKSEPVGSALVAALGVSPDRLDNVSEEELKGLLSAYSQKIKNSAEPLMTKLAERNAGRLAELTKVEASLTRGDVASGAKIFFGKGVCSSCHAVAGKGAIFGPDLTNIGQIRSGHDILEAILYPSASFAREYETSRVTTKTATYTGVLKEQLSDAIIISTGPGLQVRIPRSEITGIEPLDISLMPPGLDKQLSPQELSDLMAYLNTLPDGIGNLVKRK
ncbi:putative membrane-bound dehydrogenase domain-containing protein [Daejeonella rubra]|uniref:Putative membrane-bound dehydrogenase domain-containing protein n=1 Tax=Daejeonella rubra TaxID=990371 RepID=A0A1G9NV03_9SPHI|nr:PVC-type heme-binding CxxCH protein [Daejeonella rubra]SDL90204.1 putative membrane-bound dehydrogenase domain-containing protein [Daejeonella rubra]